MYQTGNCPAAASQKTPKKLTTALSLPSPKPGIYKKSTVQKGHKADYFETFFKI
jgi:hypothetical protein